MQASQAPVIWTIIISALIIVVSVFWLSSTIPEIPEIVIPTASEIAAAIVIPTVEVPEMPTTYIDLRDDLKTQSLSVCNEEFDMDDLLDDTGLDSDYDDDEVTVVREYLDDRHIYYVNVGIDNADDRHMNIDRVFKIDVDDDYKDKVYVTCEVTSDDGELEAELSYSL